MLHYLPKIILQLWARIQKTQNYTITLLQPLNPALILSYLYLFLFSFAAFSSSWWSCPGQPEKGSSLLRSKIGSIKNISIMKLKKLGHFIEDNFFLYFVTTPSLVAAANLKIPSENGKEKNQTWLVCNSMFKIISIILAPKWNRCFFYTF